MASAKGSDAKSHPGSFISKSLIAFRLKAYLGEMGKDDTTAEVDKEVAHEDAPPRQAHVQPALKGELFQGHQGVRTGRGEAKRQKVSRVRVRGRVTSR